MSQTDYIRGFEEGRARATRRAAQIVATAAEMSNPVDTSLVLRRVQRVIEGATSPARPEPPSLAKRALGWFVGER